MILQFKKIILISLITRKQICIDVYFIQASVNIERIDMVYM